MIQFLIAGLGTVLFCICARSWRDVHRLVYDIVGSLVPFLFIVQLVFEGIESGIDNYWIARAGIIAVLTIVLAGRLFKEWAVSGHLSFVLAIAIVQGADQRLFWFERLLFLLSVPIIIAIRWKILDRGRHFQTYSATILAITCALIVLLFTRL